LQETNACAYTAPLQLDIEEMQRERRPNGQRGKQENGKTKKGEAKEERYSRDAQRMKDRKLKGIGDDYVEIIKRGVAAFPLVLISQFKHCLIDISM